jgi:hypothetical protein
VWDSESELWSHLVAHMAGRWSRLEASYPEGMPDSFGLWMGRTIWLEHKVGKPDRNLLRPKQIEFGLECMQRGVPYWVCFGYRNDVMFFDSYVFMFPKWPKFWVP